MSKGVYQRTAKHIDQCRRAGKISADKKRIDFKCPICGIEKRLARWLNRKYCSKQCFDIVQTYTDRNKMSYSTIHAWVRRNFGTPYKCENCGTEKSKKFEWANISKEYLLNRSDWVRLCCQCHRRYDVGTKNKIELQHG